MADYHIYLHSNEGNSLASNTQPKDAEESMGGVFVPKTFIKDANKIANMSAGGLFKTGAAELAKVHPQAALAVAAVKGTEKVLSTGFEHLQSYTGNYEFSMEFNNFMTIINMTPVSFIYKSIKLNYQTKKFNDKQQAFRELMGENFVGI